MKQGINPEERLAAIKKMITTQPVSDQHTLVDLLLAKHGIKTTQSILSRDLRKLGVIKREVDKKMVYALPDADVTSSILKLAVIEVKYNESMIVVKTHSGLAPFVGDYIDSQEDLDILGCLAGENVVFVTCTSIKDIEKTHQQLTKKLFLNSQQEEFSE